MLTITLLRMEEGTSMKFNAGAVKRLERILNDSSYREAVENSANYNSHLCIERKTRLPFLDAQTGVAQSDSNLWMPKWQRMPGQNVGQLYTYPARRWKKKRWQYLMNDRYLTRRIREKDVTDGDMCQISVVENAMFGLEDGGENNIEKLTEDSKDLWFREFEDLSEFPDLGGHDDPESDVEDYEETYTRKKKRKVQQSTRGRKRGERIEYTDAEKPYSCEICGARYKSRPGLSYHYSHSHNNNSDNAEEEANSIPPKVSTMSSSSSSAGTQSDDPLAGLRKFQDSFLSFLSSPSNAQKNISDKPLASPSPYCDFCVGDSSENKKTRLAEELVSCADCGRSAHPTCLQFTPIMTAAVKNYRWQCIECKSCGLCGTSDNDDQLLFCDDCDRGYHMYCLNPPLLNPPQGSWSCHLCTEEFHGRRKQME
ncbi:zinc finger protein ubi-d4 B-like isoform X1 [Limulus polyphemus]|uniref:Zinc finger protein ubi-d4 B-like isoform X1 n=1 Tax=Limulus polyphemus TaxID=6850 RepID=A0ABM1SM84_LIMPO|nr:zinc finger protein ubi-d4 B-like isoform X1 [Limulus polyphemus]